MTRRKKRREKMRTRRWRSKTENVREIIMKNIGSSTSQNCDGEISPRNELWVKFGKWKKREKLRKDRRQKT